MAQDDQLLRPVGGGHPDPVALPQLIGGPLDVGVRRLRLLGVDHMDAVVLLHGPLAPPDLIGVKDGDDLAFPVTLVVAKKVAQGLPGRVQALPGHGLQLVPGEDDVVPVHQQILRPRGLAGDVPALRRVG